MKNINIVFIALCILLAVGMLSICNICYNRGFDAGKVVKAESFTYEIVIIEDFECVRIPDGKGAYSYLGPLPNTVEDREQK
tara:strand:- start:6780 stop:7022 length:243 start_codon:yes stop_codon:yes gene_type:complete